MKTPAERANNTAAYVTCHGGLVEGDKGCGVQPLAEREYLAQLERPNRGWHCPKCGNSAEYNDTESERVQGVYDELCDPVVVLADIPAPVLDEIGIERKRQQIVEGFTTEHDDEHVGGQLVWAAVCYAEAAAWDSTCRAFPATEEQRAAISPPEKWPWEPAAWMPKDQRRDLIRAVALLVAEIERLDRKAAREQVPA